jgi:Zn-dependent protease
MDILNRLPISLLFNGDIQGFFLRLLLILPGLIIGLSFHEAAHAWMANKMGDPTAKNLGRLTLDPIKHFDAFGFASLALFGFGWGKPVPINSRTFRNFKKANVLVSLAGVILNLIIGLIVIIILSILRKSGVFSNALILEIYGGDLSVLGIVYLMIYYIAYINLLLCIFNLIPVPPLDGSHLIEGFLAKISHSFYQAYHRYGNFLLIALLFLVPGFGALLWNIVNTVINLVASIFGVYLP